MHIKNVSRVFYMCNKVQNSSQPNITVEKKNVKRLPTFMLACFDKRHNLNYLPEDVTDASLVNEVLKFLFITAADLVQKRIATGHKAKPKESLKAISTGTSGTESWKHT